MEALGEAGELVAGLAARPADPAPDELAADEVVADLLGCLLLDVEQCVHGVVDPVDGDRAIADSMNVHLAGMFAIPLGPTDGARSGARARLGHAEGTKEISATNRRRSSGELDAG